MPYVEIVAALGPNNEIGVKRSSGAWSLPWHRPGDLAFFRSRTMGKICVMGKVTSSTIPHLDGRVRVVVGKNCEFHSVQSALYALDQHDLVLPSTALSQAALIGGAGVFYEGEQFTNRMWITRVPKGHILTADIQDVRYFHPTRSLWDIEELSHPYDESLQLFCYTRRHLSVAE